MARRNIFHSLAEKEKDFALERIITIRGSATYFMLIPLFTIAPLLITAGISLFKEANVTTTFVIYGLFMYSLIILCSLHAAITEQLQNRRIVDIDQANNTITTKTSFLWYAKVVTHKLSDFTVVTSYIAGGVKGNIVALLTNDRRGLPILQVRTKSEALPTKPFRLTEHEAVESPHAKSLRMELSESLGLKDGGFQTKQVLFRKI